MKPFRYALISLLLPLLLVACAQQDDAAPTTTAPAAAPAVEHAPASAAAAADTASTDAPAQTAPAQATTPQGPAPVEGTHYVVVEDAQPLQPLNDQIEVVEVFGYTCGACASFDPLISAWEKRQPEDVRVTMLPAAFGGIWDTFAKAYYAAESMDLAEATHGPMFRALHVDRSLSPQGLNTNVLAAFYAQHGADERRFAQTMESFAVAGQVRRAQQFAVAAGVDATPTMIVNGKYRVVSGQDFQDVLRIVDHLVARERAAGGSDTAQ
ncbi:thiol:disulfide interchange protein DsbA/DsbL [Luteimonas sp. MJ293]|uniref:thiol:disulfide interchange protein DsbA/DsbL n=1 Tax=Luteimonas sp. MJ146 TaxID=3129240 RepID=UPI0031BA4154